ncbi:hypothetical protein HGA92_04800 [Candidatus Gracilibacteria bacterium]|nr:hypothetical protein [Candidatus Gracilibacteria bacterium]NUJ98446.1 hypothetical protein [Candidatus Gracilibacteria bacterium]
MEFLIYTYLIGVLEGLISIGFRIFEIKNKSIYMGKQIVFQMLLFILFLFIFQKYFYFYELHIFGMNLSWFWIFFIISNISFFIVKILFEWISGIPLYPSEEELEELMKKIENDDEN